jgi:hypothetical protein
MVSTIAVRAGPRGRGLVLRALAHSMRLAHAILCVIRLLGFELYVRAFGMRQANTI